ncbi:MAG: DUF2892 domain-containing protein [Halorhabdus sp.]
MEPNVGSADQYVRLVLGIVLGIVGIAVFVGPLSSLGVVVGVLALIAGAVMIGTGVTRQCLLYRPLGIDTSDR